MILIPKCNLACSKKTTLFIGFEGTFFLSLFTEHIPCNVLNMGHKNCQQFVACYMYMTAGRTNNIFVVSSCANLKGKMETFCTLMIQLPS